MELGRYADAVAENIQSGKVPFDSKHKPELGNLTSKGDFQLSCNQPNRYMNMLPNQWIGVILNFDEDMPFSLIHIAILSLN